MSAASVVTLAVVLALAALAAWRSFKKGMPCECGCGKACCSCQCKK